MEYLIVIQSLLILDKFCCIGDLNKSRMIYCKKNCFSVSYYKISDNNIYYQRNKDYENKHEIVTINQIEKKHQKNIMEITKKGCENNHEKLLDPLLEWNMAKKSKHYV